MAKRHKHTDNKFSQYLKYFKGLLSGKDQHILEKKMMQDKFEMEAYEGMSSVDPTDLESDITDLHLEINRRTKSKKKRLMPLLRYAAAVAILIAVGSIALLVKKPGVNKSKLAQQIELIDSAEIKPVELSVIEDDTVKPVIAQIIKTEKQKSFSEKVIEKHEKPAHVKRETIEQLSRKQENIKIDEEHPQEDISQIVDKGSDKSGTVSGMVAGSGQIPQRGQTSTTTIPELKSIAYNEQIKNNTSTIKGRVMDAGYEEPLPGVNVVVKGTNYGTTTDLEGNFSIDVPAGHKNTLEFAYIGYIQEDIEVEDEKNIEVELEEDIVALDEVVVIGYGVQKKNDVARSVTTNESEEETEEQFVQISLPKPIGGMNNYKKYIKENIHYNNLPVFDKNKIVKLGIEVTSTGKISDIRVIKSPGAKFETEAIRLIKEGPEWEPGTRDDIPASQEIILKIKFPFPE
jgi:hypothetical protein